MKRIIEAYIDNESIQLTISGSRQEIGEAMLAVLEEICQQAPDVGSLIYEKLKEWRENDGQIPL